MSEGRKAPSRAIYGCGGDPIDDDIAEEWCTDYHCAGDCGLRGPGYQHNSRRKPSALYKALADLADARREAVSARQADQQETSSFQECAANGSGPCRMGPHGIGGEDQCEWCGRPAP